MKIKNAVLIFIFAAVLILTACDGNGHMSAPIYTFTDSLGRAVEVTSYEKTAVLSGSLAEVWQLSGGELYGVTSDALDSRGLDLADDVKIYGDVKNPSIEAILADGVDLVILSGSIPNQVKLSDTFDSVGIASAYFDVEDFSDYLDMLKICTDITGRGELFAKNGESVKERVDAVLERADCSESKTVLLLRAFSTGIKAKGSDNMTGRMLSQLGCINIADSDTSLLEELSLEAVVRADPDFIFITTMGGDEAAAVAVYESQLASNPAFAGLSAARGGRVHFLPKDMFHYKPNARWGEAYEYLEELLCEKR